MKRILLSFVVLVVASAAAFAQSKGDAPYPGSKHVYSIESDGENQVWSVFTHDGAAFVPSDAAVATLTNENTKSVTIDWGVGVVAGTTYYVQVEDDLGGCRNLRMLPVTITASTFDMLLVYNGGDICYRDQVAPSIEGGQIAYTHGVAVVPYDFTVAGVNAGDEWSTTLTMTDIADVEIGGLASGDATVGVQDNGDGTYTLSGTGEVAGVTLNLTINNIKKYLEAAVYDGQAILNPVVTLSAQAIKDQNVADINNVNNQATGTVKRYTNNAITFN
ncbi:hypothetical protein OAT16_05495 [Prolixibacteraceae bacterium]|nr:hypothetical protein [Prolixibacteraceae bacterium]